MFKDIFIFLAKDSKTHLQNYKILVKKHSTNEFYFIKIGSFIG